MVQAAWFEPDIQNSVLSTMGEDQMAGEQGTRYEAVIPTADSSVHKGRPEKLVPYKLYLLHYCQSQATSNIFVASKLFNLLIQLQSLTTTNQLELGGHC